VPNPDERLYDLLDAAIAECKAWVPAPVVADQRESLRSQ
jgi:hypothetical protein